MKISEVLNLGLRESTPILAGLYAHKLGDENLSSILDLLAPIWVNLSAANCVSNCAFHKDHKKAVALNAIKYDSAEMYVRRASCMPSGTWPIFHYSGVFGGDAVNDIVRELEDLLMPLILKSEKYYDISLDEKRKILSKRLKFFKERGKPVFIVLDYSKNVATLLPAIQNSLPYITLFLLTGENLPQSIELGILDCKFLLPELGLEAEDEALDEVNCAYDFLIPKSATE